MPKPSAELSIHPTIWRQIRTFADPNEADIYNHLAFYAGRLRRLRSMNLVEERVTTLFDIHSDLYLEPFNDANPQSSLGRLVSTAIESEEIVGVQVRLPIVEHNRNRFELFAEFRPGIYEGALELLFAAKRPDFLTGGIYAEKFGEGETLQDDRIGKDLYMWTMRFTPESMAHGLIGATQRVVDPLGNWSVRKLKMQSDFLDNSWGARDLMAKVDPSLQGPDRIADMFRVYRDFTILKRRALLYLPRSEETNYLYSVVPTNYIVSQLERYFHHPMNEVALMIGLQILQTLGFSTIRAVSEEANKSLQKHRNQGADLAAFSLNEHFGKFMTDGRRGPDDPFPHLLKMKQDPLETFYPLLSQRLQAYLLQNRDQI